MPRGKLLRRFMSETYFGGFDYIAGAKQRSRKILWCLVVCFCLIGLAYQEVGSVVNYARSMPSTSYDVELKEEMQLPDAIVCLPSGFDLQRARALSVPMTVVSQLMFRYITYAIELSTTEPLVRHAIRNLADYTKYVSKHNVTDRELVDKLTFQAFDLFTRGCGLIKGPFDNQEQKCQTSRKFFLPFAGLCFEVKSPKQFVAGSGLGLDIRLNANSQRQHPGLGVMRHNGLYLLLSHDGNIDPDAIALATQSTTHVSLEAVRTITKPSTKNKCVQDAPQSNLECIGKCYDDAVLGHCGCTFADIAAMVNRSACSFPELLRCAFRTGAPKPTQRWDIAKVCQAERCRQACTRTDYRKTVSSFRTNHSGDDLHELVHLRLYFGRMHMLTIEQFYPTSLGDLFGIIGGLLGLWMGGSVIALVHLLTFWMSHGKRYVGRRLAQLKRQGALAIVLPK